MQNTEFNCRNSSAACIFALALRCQGNLINPVPQTILGVEGRRAFKKSSGAACMLALTLLCQGRSCADTPAFGGQCGETVGC